MQYYQPVHLSAEAKLLLQAQVLDAVEQAIMAVDLTGRIVFWNRYAETLSGWSAEEAQGRNIDEVFGTSLLMESVHANLVHLHDIATGSAPASGGAGWSGEFLVQRRGGTTFMAQLSLSLIQIEQQSMISMAAISREGTEPQQIQEVNRLLAEASALLVDAVDYEAPLTTMAQLAVPHLADWCAVHLLQDDGSIEQVALAPAGLAAKQVAHQQAAHDWLQNHLTMNDTDGLPAVFRSSEPKLVTDAASDVWAAAAAIKSYMIVPLITQPKILGTITFVTAESGRRFDRNALALAENLASHITIYLDNVRLYGESQRLNAELELRVNERTGELLTAVSQLKQAVEQLKQSEATIQTLFRISNKLNATLEVSTILDELAQEAIRIVNGESGFAGLRTAGGMTVRKYFRQGVAIPFAYTWPPGQGIPGWVLKHKVPYGTSDAAHDPVIEHDLVINADVRSIICTPILDSLGEALGYFDIRNKQGGEGFTIGDQEMLMALAPAASIAIQNALAYQQRLATVAELKESSRQLQALAANLESAREEERTRIARELHDQLGQALTAMKFDLAWLADRLAHKDVALAEKAKTVTTEMDTMIKTVRRISTELRPGMLDDLGLAASIEWQARDFEKRTGIMCVVHVPTEELSLTRAQSIALFRIFQEALTNVARHAGAQLIEVILETSPEMLTLQVQDNGRGIQVQEIAGLHALGLLGMRERAKRLGGALDIQGVSGEGTIVTVSIPVKQILVEAFPQAVFGEAQNAHEVLELIGSERWDIVVLDLNMPGGNGLEALKQIKRDHPPLPVLILTMFPEDQYAVRTIRAGAAGYLNKESAPEELVQAIHKILRGGKYISAAVADELVLFARNEDDQPLHKHLSDREYQVLCSIASGKEVKEISIELALSAKTISTYRARILEKMNMKTNAELTHYAIQNGLV